MAVNNKKRSKQHKRGPSGHQRIDEQATKRTAVTPYEGCPLPQPEDRNKPRCIAVTEAGYQCCRSAVLNVDLYNEWKLLNRSVPLPRFKCCVFCKQHLSVLVAKGSVAVATKMMSALAARLLPGYSDMSKIDQMMRDPTGSNDPLKRLYYELKV